MCELRFCLQWVFKHVPLLRIPLCVSKAFLVYLLCLAAWQVDLDRCVAECRLQRLLLVNACCYITSCSAWWGAVRWVFRAVSKVQMEHIDSRRQTYIQPFRHDSRLCGQIYSQLQRQTGGSSPSRSRY